MSTRPCVTPPPRLMSSVNGSWLPLASLTSIFGSLPEARLAEKTCAGSPFTRSTRPCAIVRSVRWALWSASKNGTGYVYVVPSTVIVQVSPLTNSPASWTKTSVKCACAEPSAAMISFVGTNSVGFGFEYADGRSCLTGVIVRRGPPRETIRSFVVASRDAV